MSTSLKFALVMASLSLSGAPLLAGCAAGPGDDLSDQDDAAGERLGEAGEELSTWVADTAISGQASQSAPALTTYNYDAFMVHRGANDNSLWMSTYDSVNWSVNQKISGQTSKATVGLTQHGTKLHMAYLCGPSAAICYSTYPNGNPWSAPVTLSYMSNLPPVLVSEPITNRLMLAFTAPGGTIQWAFNDGNWHNPDALVHNSGLWLTAKAPALAVHQGRVHLVFEDINGLLQHTSFNGTSWEPTNAIGYKPERDNPVLASYAGTLYLFHRGAYDNSIWWSSSPDGVNWTADVSVPGASTQQSPAITTSGIVLMLTHMASSGTSLRYSTFTW